MKSKICLLVSLIACICCVLGHDELPNFIHVCKRSEPDIDACFRKSVETIRPHLINGIPEMDVPKIEPLTIGDLLLSEKSRTTGGGITVSAKAIVAYGSSNFDVTKVEVIEFGKKYAVEVAIPELYVKGKYEVEGMLILLPLNEAGKFTGNFTKCAGRATVQLDEITKDGERHIKIKKFIVRVTLERGSINLENLFNGNKELAQVVNESINANFDSYSRDIIPLVEKSLAKYFSRVANKVFERFTVEQLFPQN